MTMLRMKLIKPIEILDNAVNYLSVTSLISEIYSRSLTELQVFYFLRTIFGADFPIHHWTSKSRAKFGNLSFTGQEGDYSDFTFDDPNDIWTAVLIQAGFDEAKGWKDRAKDQAITYHLEVKSTSGPFNDPFYMSFNQLQMVR